MSPDERERLIARRVRNTGLACLGLAVSMVGAAYASVPLYGLFCRITGYDGTPMIGTRAATEVLERVVSVRFDTNVAPGLDWSFAPETRSMDVRVGETVTTFFKVRNEGRRAATGIASYNVQPGQAGAFFVKLKCFCFEDQALKPGESIDFPVVFYVDPSLKADRNLDGLSTITLSYTYFASKNGQPVTTVSQDSARPKL